MYIQKYSKGTHIDVHIIGEEHTLETDFIQLASQFWMSVHLFLLVPKCCILPRSGQVTKPLSQNNPFFLSNDTIVSINLISCESFRANQRASGKDLEMLMSHVWHNWGTTMASFC